MYYFLVQTSIDLGGIQRSRVRVTALARSFFRAFAESDETEGSLLSIFFGLRFFSNLFVFQGSPFNFIEVPWSK